MVTALDESTLDSEAPSRNILSFLVRVLLLGEYSSKAVLLIQVLSDLVESLIAGKWPNVSS